MDSTPKCCVLDYLRKEMTHCNCVLKAENGDLLTHCMTILLIDNKLSGHYVNIWQVTVL